MATIKLGYPVYCKLSITIADAPPPPLQMPAHPILPFFSLRTLRRVVVILAPEAPRASWMTPMDVPFNRLEILDVMGMALLWSVFIMRAV